MNSRLHNTLVVVLLVTATITFISASPTPQLFGAGISYGSSSGGYQQAGGYNQGYGYNNGFGGLGASYGGGFGPGLLPNSFGSGYQQLGAGHHSSGLQAGFGIGRR